MKRTISWTQQVKTERLSVTIEAYHEVEGERGDFSFYVRVSDEGGNGWWGKNFERGVDGVPVEEMDATVRSVVSAVAKDVEETFKHPILGDVEQLCHHILTILRNFHRISLPASMTEKSEETHQPPSHPPSTTSPAPTPPLESDVFPSLATIYNRLLERGYDEEDIYIILDVGRKSLESDMFPLQEEEYAVLAERLFTPIGEEKAVNLVRMFLDANPHLVQQCEIPVEQLTPSNVRINKQIRDYFFKKLVKTFRFAVFRYIHDKLKKKRLRDTLNIEDIVQWKMADYYYLRFHILEQKITAKWIS